jgi:ribosomal protein L40E
MSGKCKYCGEVLGTGDAETRHAGECPVMLSDGPTDEEIAQVIIKANEVTKCVRCGVRNRMSAFMMCRECMAEFREKVKNGA